MKDENDIEIKMINPLDLLKSELYEPKVESGESETEASDDYEAIKNEIKEEMQHSNMFI